MNRNVEQLNNKIQEHPLKPKKKGVQALWIKVSMHEIKIILAIIT
jgi:hypothetical protein